MTLRSTLGELAVALQVPEAQRDGEWGYRVCGLSQEIHFSVSAELPDNRYVSEDIIPLLEEAREALRTLPRAGRFAAYIDVFVENVGLRLSDLQQYVSKGKLAIRPGERLKGPLAEEALAAPQEAQTAEDET